MTEITRSRPHTAVSERVAAVLILSGILLSKGSLEIHIDQA